MAEHPVTRKLRVEMLPYVVFAGTLNKSWPCRTHRIYVYANDILTLIVGLGFSQPVLSVLGVLAGKQTQTTVAGALADASSLTFFVGVSAAILWGITKIVINREGIEKRAVLAESCRTQFAIIENKLRRALADADPMPKLNTIAEEIYAAADKAIQEKAWREDLESRPGAKTTSALEAYVNGITNYEANWKAPPQQAALQA